MIFCMRDIVACCRCVLGDDEEVPGPAAGPDDQPAVVSRRHEPVRGPSDGAGYGRRGEGQPVCQHRGVC